MVLHYAVVLYTRLAPYRDNYLLLSYDNFYVKARKIYKFFEGGCRGILKASAGQVCSFGTGPKSFLESPYSLSKKLYAGKGKGYAGPKSSFESPHLPPKTLCTRRERPAWDAGRKVVFRILLQPL